MTIRGQHGKHHLHFHTVLVFAVLAVIFTTALTAAGLSGDQTGKHTVRTPARFISKSGGMGECPRSRTGEDSRMDLARSRSEQPRRGPRLRPIGLLKASRA